MATRRPDRHIDTTRRKRDTVNYRLLPKTEAGRIRLIARLEVVAEHAARAVDRAPDDPNLIILAAAVNRLRQPFDYDGDTAKQ